MLVLHPPVDAPVIRAFHHAGSPYAAGHHRGVDLGAVRGAPVVAPCGGRVVFAGFTPPGGAVTLACAGKLVTVLPVLALRVRAGDTVGPRAPLGAVAAGDGRHPGLHLSVRRRPGDRSYLDPAAFLRRRANSPVDAVPPAPRGGGPRAAERSPTAVRSPGSVRSPRVAPAAPGRPAAGSPSPSLPAPARRRPPGAAEGDGAGGGTPPLAPWPAWVGAALALLGAADAGRRRDRRRRTSRAVLAGASAAREGRP